VRIATGSTERLTLGNISIERDWGWAPEYVEAMWLMLQRRKLDDFVIATGTTCSLQYLVECAFQHLGLDWRQHVDCDETLLRPTELSKGMANPEKAKQELGWVAHYRVRDIVRMMLQAEKKVSS